MLKRCSPASGPGLYWRASPRVYGDRLHLPGTVGDKHSHPPSRHNAHQALGELHSGPSLCWHDAVPGRAAFAQHTLQCLANGIQPCKPWLGQTPFPRILLPSIACSASRGQSHHLPAEARARVQFTQGLLCGAVACRPDKSQMAG